MTWEGIHEQVTPMSRSFKGVFRARNAVTIKSFCYQHEFLWAASRWNVGTWNFGVCWIKQGTLSPSCLEEVSWYVALLRFLQANIVVATGRRRRGAKLSSHEAKLRIKSARWFWLVWWSMVSMDICWVGANSQLCSFSSFLISVEV